MRDTKVVGYTEASRGCKHTCRHCPIVPVYDGRFRVVPIDIVLADVRAQVAAGARHVTFGDPDFFNGIRHAMAVVHAVHAEFPDLSYDVTIKIEHLLAHADRLPELTATGCAFVTSAVESVDDDILERLAKGHTLADFERAVALCRDAGSRCRRPSSLSRRGRRWTAIARCCRRSIGSDWSSRSRRSSWPSGCWSPPAPASSSSPTSSGSRRVRCRTTMTYPWRHADPAVDRLHAMVAGIAGERGSDSRARDLRPDLGRGARRRRLDAAGPRERDGERARRSPT